LLFPPDGSLRDTSELTLAICNSYAECSVSRQQLPESDETGEGQDCYGKYEVANKTRGIKPIISEVILYLRKLLHSLNVLIILR
jgi:hypothetical protein